MIKILMAMYGITAEQAAARLPAAQFVLTAAIAALFVWLDSNGALDGVGRWMGRMKEMLNGVTHMVRNVTAHELKVKWVVNEQDAIDILTTISFLHKQLDECIVVPQYQKK